MDHFARNDKGELCCEGASLQEIAKQFGTPSYIYSRATITRHVRVLQEGLAAIPHHICYAVKANANLAVLDLLKSLGCGFDAVSVGELRRTQAIDADPSEIIFSGVGKRDDEIEAALLGKVLYICVESADELWAIARIAEKLGVRAPVSIRVNPDVDAKTHPYIATGLKKNKFGVPHVEARGLYKEALKSPHLDMIGVTCHIGSQITELQPFRDAAMLMREIATDLVELGVPIRYLGMGGGLGVPYGEEAPPNPAAYGETLAEILGELKLTIVVEPGRVIVGNAGILLTEVVRMKESGERFFAMVDAGMNDLLRPALYQATHRIELVRQQASGDVKREHDIVGPVCESADTFAEALSLPELRQGDLLALRTAGAYGFAMASTYNGRPLAAEIMVDHEKVQVIRKRQELEDLWRGEQRLA